MKNFNLLSLIALCLLTMASCSKDDPDQNNSQNPDVFYFNSFESDMDFNDFEGNAFSQLDDAPSNAGDNCLLVSGGCVGAHFSLDLGPFQSDKTLSVNLMGKSESGCGWFSMRSMNDPDEIIEIYIDQGDWKLYAPDETLVLESGAILNVSIYSGGLFSCPSLFDLLTIEEE